MREDFFLISKVLSLFEESNSTHKVWKARISSLHALSEPGAITHPHFIDENAKAQRI